MLLSFSGKASVARALSLQLCLISLLMACMNNRGRGAAEILISSTVNREMFQPPRVGRFGAYRVFLEYSYLSSAAVYSQGKTMPSLQSLAGTRGEDTDHINALFVRRCALTPLWVSAAAPPSPIFRATLCEARAVKFKENYIVLFMEDNSINNRSLNVV